MATHNLKLLFLGQRKRGFPGTAVSHVQVKTFARHRYHIGKGGRQVLSMPLITPQAFSFPELRGYIRGLRRELDEIEEQARKKYALHERRTR